MVLFRRNSTIAYNSMATCFGLF